MNIKNIIFITLAITLSAFVYYTMPTSKDKLVVIGKKNFLIPAVVNAGFHTDRNRIEFIVNSETYEVMQREDSLPSKAKRVSAEFTEYSKTEYGFPSLLDKSENKFLNPDKFFNCRPYTRDNKKYQFCEYNRGQEAVPAWGDHVYVLQEEGQKHPILLIGCNSPDKGIFPMCEGEGVMLDNIFIRYTYSAENLHKALEIDEAVREGVVNFKKLAEHSALSQPQ